MMTPLRKAIFQLLCEIDDICRENDITYYLHAGSVIGAIRHHGIIPWDDDADIAITRSNWMKLEPLLKNVSIKDRALVIPSEYDDYLFAYPQYKDTSTTMYFKTISFPSFPIGVFVDILIMDPVKDSERSIKKHKETLKLLSEIRCDRFVQNRSTNWHKYFIYKLAEKFCGRTNIIKYLERRLEKVSEDKCGGYIQRSGVHPVFWDKKFFSKPEYVKVEGRLFPVPTHPEEFLRYTYGDGWIKYPADFNEAITDGFHGFKVELDYSYKKIQNDFNKVIDIKRYNNEWKIYKYWRVKAIPHENKVRISNTKYLAEIHAYAINQNLKQKNLNLVFNQNRYQQLEKWLRYYLELQLSRRFVRDEIPIPVTDEIFYITCMILILKGEYEKAVQIINLNRKINRSTKICSELETIVNQTRCLSVAIYEHKCNWEEISELFETVLPKYPHHVDFIAAKCMFLLHKREKKYTQCVVDICERELCYHPDCDVLLKCLADAKMLCGCKQEAESLYKKLYYSTYNGMIRLKLEDLFGWEKINIIEENKNFLDDYQWKKDKKLRENSNLLLSELNEICQKEKIQYFLGGSLIENILNKKDAVSEVSYYIILHPADRIRFINAVQKNLKPNRKLESFENNKNYPDFSIRYCNTDTIDFNLKAKGFYKFNGINITIYFVRPIDKRKNIKIFKRMFYTVIEALAYPSAFNYLSKRKVAAGLIGKIVAIFLGKKRLKKIAWKIIFTPDLCEKRINGYIKDFWSKSIKLPKLDFSVCKHCIFNGDDYPIPSNYKNYVNAQLSINRVPFIKKTTIKLPHVVEFNVSCESVLNNLCNLKLKRRYFKASKKLGRINKIVKTDTAYTNYAWNIILRSADRFRMYKKYAPLKDKLLELDKKNNFLELEKLLSNYMEAIEQNDVRGMSLVFDSEIFEIACKLLEKQGKYTMVSRLKNRASLEHLEQMTYSCGKVSNMKKAKDIDKKQILSYLEKDIENCLYMYADVSKYGVSSKNIDVWYDTDNIGVRMVVMKYHENFQIYTNRGFDDIEGILNLINLEKPFGISARKEIILNINEHLKSEYKSEFGVIFCGKSIDTDKLKERLDGCGVSIELARESEAPEIAHLLCMDEELKTVYTEESMTRELEDRIKTKMGRSYIIRNRDEIVAHNATYAECDKFVIVSGLMVHPDFRDTEYAYWLDLKSSLEFQMEGKERYFFALNEKIIRWHEKIKTPKVAEYGKLSLREKE